MRQRFIFLFWLPLFASWLLMTAEGPLISAAINRMPDEVVMLAAMGVVFSVAIAIESPIINLLATSTALVEDGASYRTVRRFTLHWIVALTAVAVLVAFTPLFDLVVIRVMGAPAEVARWVEPGLQVMVLWSAAIAWRRFLQGVLIARGRTRMVAWGTAVRLLGSAGTAIGLALWGGVAGIYVGSVALMVGVTAEAAFASWAVRPLLDEEWFTADGPEPLSYGELFRFHLPLASTAVLTLLMQPLVTACLARLDRPLLSLAAWPLIFQFMLLARAPAFALPEVVIALGGRPGATSALRRFSWLLSSAGLVAMILFAATPAARFYLLDVQSATPAVSREAVIGFLLLIPLPLLATLTAWLRGVLIQHKVTSAVNEAVMVRLVATVLVLGAGLWLAAPGIATASAAVVLSSAAELAYLVAVRDRRHPRT